MRNSILALVLLFAAPAAYAADQVDLNGFESVTVFCKPSENPDCPVLEPNERAAHGGDHKRVAKKTNQDCRVCHGDDLRGTVLSIADHESTCIAPDKLQLPHNVMETERWITTWPDSNIINVVGTPTARINIGDEVGCDMCHEEVEFHDANGNEIEMDVR